MKEITEFWAGWFVGFTDGEGCFVIVKNSQVNPCSNYRCRFAIELRDDDKPILEEIRDTLGIGKIYDKPVYPSDTPNAQPQTMFRVSTTNECAALVKLFSKYPLRAKKQRDFSIWKQAVAELQKPCDSRDANLLEYYFQMIKEVRRYDEQELPVKPITVNLQLTIKFDETGGESHA